MCVYAIRLSIVGVTGDRPPRKFVQGVSTGLLDLFPFQGASDSLAKTVFTLYYCMTYKVLCINLLIGWGSDTNSVLELRTWYCCTLYCLA